MLDEQRNSKTYNYYNRIVTVRFSWYESHLLISRKQIKTSWVRGEEDFQKYSRPGMCVYIFRSCVCAYVYVCMYMYVCVVCCLYVYMCV